jgi:hypothetical protein
MNELRNRRILFHTTTLILIALGAAGLVLWSWNASMTTIFGLPSIHIKESIGLVTLVLIFSLIVKPGKGRFNHFGGDK